MKNTILGAFFALLPASLLADEQLATESKSVEITQDNIFQLKFDWHLIEQKSIGFDWFGTERRSSNVLLAETIKERDRLKKRLAELESIIERLSKP